MAITTSTALALASIATAAVGTGVSIYAQNEQAESQQRVAEHNAKLAEAEAQNRELESREQIIRERERKKRRLATLRNQLAGNGFLTTSGSPLAILGEANANAEVGIMDAVRRTSIEASSLRSQGQMGLWEADQYSAAARTSALGTALKGASSGVSSYYDFHRAGALP